MKKQLTAEQKQLDTDLWIILLITLGTFFCYAAMGTHGAVYLPSALFGMPYKFLPNPAAPSVPSQP